MNDPDGWAKAMTASADYWPLWLDEVIEVDRNPQFLGGSDYFDFQPGLVAFNFGLRQIHDPCFQSLRQIGGDLDCSIVMQGAVRDLDH